MNTSMVRGVPMNLIQLLLFGAASAALVLLIVFVPLCYSLIRRS